MIWIGCGWCTSISARSSNTTSARARGRRACLRPDPWPPHACDRPRLHQRIDARTQAFGHMPPRKAEHQRRTQHRQHDADQPRTRKTQPPHAGRPHQITQYATGVAWQGGLETVQARPLQRRAGAQQQHQAAPETVRATTSGWLAAVPLRHLAPAHPVRQRRQPCTHAGRHAPPDGKSQHKIAAIGQPGTQAAHPIAHQSGPAHARGRPRRVRGRIAQQGQQPENQGQQTQRPAPFHGQNGHLRCVRRTCRQRMHSVCSGNRS